MPEKAKKQKAPWEKPAPKGKKHTKLSNLQRKKAKARAEKAGRPYPNLVDNMAVAREAKESH